MPTNSKQSRPPELHSNAQHPVENPLAVETRRLGDQFLASLNHDIRTPLSGIMGMTDLLLETALDEEQKEYVQTVRLCADQLHEMLHEALEYTAVASNGVQIEKAEFHLPGMLTALLSEFAPKAEAKGLKMTGHWQDELSGYVIGDELRLRQLISPLLANAIKFTHYGDVVLSASEHATGADSVELIIEVRDTGIGIPSDKLDTVFESFRQLESGLSRSYAGMGLGLALARKLAVLMGGDISVESDLDAGSRFRVSVPMELPPQAAADGIDSSALSSETPSPRVLFVDDNDVARRVVMHVLGRAGYHIDCASGGREGIVAAANTQYDLILMDLQMPNVNGLTATAEIRKMPPYRSVPILALSANYSEEFMRRCRKAGFQDFLSKPIQGEQLVQALERYLK